MLHRKATRHDGYLTVTLSSLQSATLSRLKFGTCYNLPAVENSVRVCMSAVASEGPSLEKHTHESLKKRTKT